MSQSVSPADRKRRRRALAIAIACGFLVVLPSCGIPAFRPPMPGPNVPDRFNIRRAESASDSPDGFEDASSAENSSGMRIEEFFQDRMLTELILQALAGNQELRILAEEVQAASNEIQARTGAYFPFVTVGAEAGINKVSNYTLEGAGIHDDPFLPGRYLPNPLPNYMLGPLFFWTPDIWRQLHNARDAAMFRFLAAGEGRNYAITRLVAEIADNYYELIMLDKRLQILDQTIQIMEQSLEVARALKEAGGRGTELGVQRFLAEVRRNQGEKLVVFQRIIEVENRINFLVGRFPQPVERMTGDFIDLSLHGLSMGVPVDLLHNRPDIRQAERALAAAGLDVKVARKNFYPKGVVTSGVGYQAFNPVYLFITPEALIASVAGQLVAPLINKAALKAEYKTANARQLQAVYNYQRVVLNAYTQVINRLSQVENYRKSIEFRKQQVAALDDAVDVAMNLFQAARADYVDVLFAQRDLRDARTSLVETKQQQLSALVNTYQALGGGAYLGPVFNPPELKTHHWKLFKHRRSIPPEDRIVPMLPAPPGAGSVPQPLPPLPSETGPQGPPAPSPAPAPAPAPAPETETGLEPLPAKGAATGPGTAVAPDRGAGAIPPPLVPATGR
ncbi:MAG: TolC family protein [Isosphaeraceae bacterium]